MRQVIITHCSFVNGILCPFFFFSAGGLEGESYRVGQAERGVQDPHDLLAQQGAAHCGHRIQQDEVEKRKGCRMKDEYLRIPMLTLFFLTLAFENITLRPL
jgi:hypothetical protein